MPLRVEFKSKIRCVAGSVLQGAGRAGDAAKRLSEALSADPQDLKAKLGWIGNLVSQGNTAGAIKEYRDLVKASAAVRPVLARLLIAQNQRRPEPQRNWSEVNELIDQMAETEPESVEPVLRAELLFAQGNQAAARSELEKAKCGFPRVSRSGLLRPDSWESRGELTKR